MKKTVEPVKITPELELILSENIITFSGLEILSGLKELKKDSFKSKEDYENAKQEWVDLKNSDVVDELVMNYISIKQRALEKQIKKLNDNIKLFNKSIEIAKSMSIVQDLEGKINQLI